MGSKSHSIEVQGYKGLDVGVSEWSWVHRWRPTSPSFQKSKAEGATDQAMYIYSPVLQLRDLFLLFFSLTTGLMPLCQATPPAHGRLPFLM